MEVFSCEAEGRPKVEPPPVQILVVVANTQVETLEGRGRSRVPWQHRLTMGESVLRHGGNLCLRIRECGLQDVQTTPCGQRGHRMLRVERGSGQNSRTGHLAKRWQCSCSVHVQNVEGSQESEAWRVCA